MVLEQKIFWHVAKMFQLVCRNIIIRAQRKNLGSKKAWKCSLGMHKLQRKKSSYWGDAFLFVMLLQKLINQHSKCIIIGDTAVQLSRKLFWAVQISFQKENILNFIWDFWVKKNSAALYKLHCNCLGENLEEKLFLKKKRRFTLCFWHQRFCEGVKTEFYFSRAIIWEKIFCEELPYFIVFLGLLNKIFGRIVKIVFYVSSLEKPSDVLSRVFDEIFLSGLAKQHSTCP